MVAEEAAAAAAEVRNEIEEVELRWGVSVGRRSIDEMETMTAVPMEVDS